VRWTAAILLPALMAALLVSSSLHKRFVYDEFDNTSYGFRFLTKGPGVPPLGQRMPVLVMNALGCVTSGCDRDTLDASETVRLAASQMQDLVGRGVSHEDAVARIDLAAVEPRFTHGDPFLANRFHDYLADVPEAAYAAATGGSPDEKF